jgi:uncharacterized membrane protein
VSGAVAALVVAGAVGAACSGGALYAFSAFVMPALERLPPGEGVAAIVGVVGLTMGFHVPCNDAVATLAPDAAGTAGAWRTYVSEWTTANHVRAGAGLLAAAALGIALRVA